MSQLRSIGRIILGKSLWVLPEREICRSKKLVFTSIVALLVTACTLTFSNFYEQLIQDSPHLQILIRHTYSTAWRSTKPFPSCTMEACFNFSRCEGMKEPLIYHYGHPFEPDKFFAGLASSPWHTTDPHKACLFFLTQPQFFDYLTPHPSSLPFWNGGENHVIVSFADKWVAPAPHSIGHASVLGSQLHLTNYRPGFDVSLPLPTDKHFNHLQNVKPFDRKYFLTFKGRRYLGETDGNFRSHSSFKGMHNGKDVIVAVSCVNSKDRLSRKQELFKSSQACADDERVYRAYDFADLMNSTFCLAPGGRSPASYRFLETLSGGAIPVLICNDYVMPFETLIQWDKCMLQFPTSEMHRILATLRALSNEEVERRQRECLSIYNRHFKDDNRLLNSTIMSLTLRFHGVFPDFAASATL